MFFFESTERLASQCVPVLVSARVFLAPLNFAQYSPRVAFLLRVDSLPCRGKLEFL